MAGDLRATYHHHHHLHDSPPHDEFEMDDTSISHTSSTQRFPHEPSRPPRKTGAAGLARHTLGLLLLLVVVFLWTASNFLGSSIFADKSYAKPFFLTYLNTSMFMLAMIPTLVRSGYRQHRRGTLYTTMRSNLSWNKGYRPLPNTGVIDAADSESHAFIHKPTTTDPDTEEKDKHLGIIATARLSIAFCVLWFLANYFAMACLQYTTVASTTILTSTSSFWTLLIGAATGMERFTWRKFLGVMGSFLGIILISRVDFSTSADSTNPSSDNTNSPSVRAIDSFPDKSPAELALGDGLALLSAVIYGGYTISLKKTTIKALPRQLNMPLFFGLVGTFNIFLLSPLFPILHYTGIETFQPPPSAHIWMVLLVNSVSSLFSDICWAYAMVLTSPLVVTVGLSLSIPLSLVGEMVLQGRYEGWVYWVGAGIVVGSFLFVDHEEREDEEQQEPRRTSRASSWATADGLTAQGGPPGRSQHSYSQDSLIEGEASSQQDSSQLRVGRSSAASAADRPGHVRRRSSGASDVAPSHAGPGTRMNASSLSLPKNSQNDSHQSEQDLLDNDSDFK
ncbi:uncharacterized protein A1O9_11008 [Exophiala aquamarina CBS 119918]|uniref:Uncharacterized protein n=1 Tax=Exophiala aquamarina CBS 119918 TaxID=1182545 RepID=A0A072PBX8_9EURO|nr:uncharacterized protein A1O9_11008 [Exophiala aquamarina CBS 119918]KEF53100.1 hypothetical protein A1O9_11008 [Exophiala aquamarina CBS 119918]